MALKAQILSELAAARGQELSGQLLAQRLGVSRAAVWKAINALRAEGAPITAITNHGYTLAETADLLTAEEISAQLPDELHRQLKIEAADCLESTNAALRARAAAGEGEGVLLAAARQTGGRGRAGRAFYSPVGSGVYFSLLLRLKAENPAMLTAMAATAAAQAAEETCAAATGQPAPEIMIKWVNDLLLGGKKLCGILTEAALDLESGGLDYAVLGVGINLTDPAGGWPQELAPIATSLFGTAPPAAPNLRAAYTAAFVRRFWPMYKSFDAAAFLPDYRRRQAVLGRRVEVLTPAAPPREATALAIDDTCRLIVRYADTGEQRALLGGEVRVKL